MSVRRRLASFARELRRRRVFRVLLVYLGVAFGVWQIADVAIPALNLPAWGVSLVVVLSALGLPIAMAMAWVFDVTTEGVVRTDTTLPGATDGPSRARWAAVQELVGRVLNAPEEDRERVLSSVAEDHPELRDEVRLVLEAHERPGPVDDLMDAIAGGVVAATSGDIAPGSTVGPYRLSGRLGAGGMGVVYRALDERLGRDVALKFLGPEYANDPVARERFLVEARVAATLDHPNVCTILDVGELDGRPFIAMPLYDGSSLKEVLAAGPLPLDRALDVTAHVARGLVAAHEKGIIHRDIKPGNVMILETGVPKVLDFGVAKMPSLRLTRTGFPLGTLNYMSPEQTRGEAVDHRADLWSLGVVAYEMIVGERPFKGRDDNAVRTAILSSTPDAAGVEGARGAALRTIIDRCLAKDREHRFATALELVEAVERLAAETVPQGGTGVTAADPDPIRRGERRPVTVVSSVLEGYDELVEQVAPHVLEDLMRQIHQTVASAATAEGGAIHKLEADQMELVFGVPRAREDDSVRAVRVALRLGEVAPTVLEGRPDVTVPLALRTGVAVGTTAVLPNPDGPGPRYRIASPITTRAARLARSDPGSLVLVSEECHRTIRRYFVTEPGPRVATANEEGASATHRVLAPRAFESSLDARASGGLTAFTGRDEELETLRGALGRARRGQGGIVTIRGDAGVGKSRLIYEFRRGIAADRTRLLTGRCQGYGGAVPFHPFLEVLDGVLLDENGNGGIAQVNERLEELGSGLPRYAAFYHHLLSVPSSDVLPVHLSGAQLRLAIIESITALLTVACGREPCVLLLEDWHWADDASVATLRQLSALIGSHPLLAVVTHRPGYGVDLASLEHRSEMVLRPLDPELSTVVVRSALGVDTVGDDLAAAIYERAQGNPFFTEEICSGLLEQGFVTSDGGLVKVSVDVSEVDLPDSVQSTIRARLDRMDAVGREILGAASVIGRDFSRELLKATLPHVSDPGRHLETILAAGLIQQIRVVPDVTYRFRHALTQEVTYETLLAHQRRDLHRRVGDAIEAGTLEEERPLERLADHFSRARAWEKAFEYGLEGARRANRVGQFPQAMRLLELAEGALRRTRERGAPDRWLALLFLKDRICETMGQRGEQKRIVEELVPLSEKVGDPSLVAEAFLRAGDLHVVMRRYGEAEGHLLRAVEASETDPGSAIHRKALRSLGLLRWHQDRSDEAREVLHGVLEADLAAGDHDAACLDTHNLASVYRTMGDVERARELSEQSLEYAQGDPLREVYARHALAIIARIRDRPEEAEERLRHAVRICRENNLHLQQAFMLTSLAHLALAGGEVERGIEIYGEALDLGRRIHAAEATAQAASALASVLEGLGRTEEALNAWSEAQEWATRMEQADTQIEAAARIGALSEQLGRIQDAMAAWGRSRELARSRGDLPREIEALEGLARLARGHLGGDAVARPYYEEALAVAREGGCGVEEGRLLNTLGVLAWEGGELAVAERRYRDAVGCFRRLGDPPGLGLGLNSLGATLRALGEPGEARSVLEEALAHHRQHGLQTLQGHGLATLGDTLCDLGDHAGAEALYEESLGLRRRNEDRLGEGWMLERLARTASELGNLDRLRELLHDAQSIADELESEALREACARLRR